MPCVDLFQFHTFSVSFPFRFVCINEFLPSEAFFLAAHSSLESTRKQRQPSPSLFDSEVANTTPPQGSGLPAVSTAVACPITQVGPAPWPFFCAGAEISIVLLVSVVDYYTECTGFERLIRCSIECATRNGRDETRLHQP